MLSLLHYMDSRFWSQKIFIFVQKNDCICLLLGSLQHFGLIKMSHSDTSNLIKILENLIRNSSLNLSKTLILSLLYSRDSRFWSGIFSFLFKKWLFLFTFRFSENFWPYQNVLFEEIYFKHHSGNSNQHKCGFKP